MTQNLAPVAVFAYNRGDHLRETLWSLSKNPEFQKSPVYIYCDGPRSASEDKATKLAREVAHSMAPENAHFVMRDQNLGLRQSIVLGVSDLVEKYGKAIVVEDDLVVSHDFLAFMNAALDSYEGVKKVMQISGHFFPVSVDEKETPIFLPFTTTWGWATWKRAWDCFDIAGQGYEILSENGELRKRFNLDNSYPYYKMLKRQRAGLVDSWGILWYLSVFLKKGVTVYPRKSLVSNNGFDGSGYHCSPASGATQKLVSGINVSKINFTNNVVISEDEFAAVKKYLKKNSSIASRLLRRVGGFFGPAFVA